MRGSWERNPEHKTGFAVGDSCMCLAVVFWDFGFLGAQLFRSLVGTSLHPVACNLAPRVHHLRHHLSKEAPAVFACPDLLQWF